MTIDHDQQPWMQLETASEVAEAIVELYHQRGGSQYGEVVTQTAHAAQCGQQAMDDGASVPLIVAAFLHDIGHLLSGPSGDAATDRHHEDVGARFLANWFADDVTQPIRMHVTAKRYLCAVEPEYHDGLSPASVASLQLQGGPMSQSELDDFESSPGWVSAVELRRWDDLAKAVDAPTADLGTFRDLIESVVRS
ncbi:MAG: phosphonate degradation HD-domain oxygenase [Actinomycetota bacterium]